MVGGVSTGALLATHALLGTPADDAQLEAMYTQISKKNIHSERGIFSLAFGADSATCVPAHVTPSQPFLDAAGPGTERWPLRRRGPASQSD
jgi:hypothetical protein